MDVSLRCCLCEAAFSLQGAEPERMPIEAQWTGGAVLSVVYGFVCPECWQARRDEVEEQRADFAAWKGEP